MGVEAKNKKGSRNDGFYHHGKGCGRRSRLFLLGTHQNGGLRGLRGPGRRRHADHRRGRPPPLHRAVRRRARILADELLGIPPRARVSPCCFLWIAAHASELSFRKTAAEFEALTSARISHVTVMNVVHREGNLLRESGAEFARDGMRISQDALFVESTGRPLVAPAASPWFTERQADAAMSAMEKRGRRMPETSGRGWEPPHRAQPLGKSVMISLSQRS